MSPTDSTRPPVMAQKMLQKSREAESALADALTFDSIDNYTRIPGSKGDHSDDSENSSICSERSIDGFRRASDVSVFFLLVNQRNKRVTHSRGFSVGFLFYFDQKMDIYHIIESKLHNVIVKLICSYKPVHTRAKKKLTNVFTHIISCIMLH